MSKITVVEFQDTLYRITVEHDVDPEIYWGMTTSCYEVLLEEENVEAFLNGEVVYDVATDFAYRLKPGERVIDYEKEFMTRMVMCEASVSNGITRAAKFDYYEKLMQE